MTSEEPTFRRATVDDAPAMAEVLEAAFGRWPAFDIPVPAVEHLRWKMQPPGGIPAHHTLGEMDGRVISCDIRWMGQCYVDGETWLTNDGADNAIHPDYQSRGYNKLMKTSPVRRMQPGDMGITTPSHNERVLKNRSEQPRAYRQLHVWSRTFDLRTAVGSHFHTGGTGHLLSKLPRLLSRHEPSTQPPPGTRIEVIEQFDDRADALWETVSATLDVARVRNAAYLNWRYADPRAGDTLVLGAFDGSSAAGAGPSSGPGGALTGDGGMLLAFAVFRRNNGRANLVDLVSHPEHRVAAAPLVAEGCARLRAEGCQSITAWMTPGHPDEAALVGARFEEIGRAVSLEFDAPPGHVADPAFLERLAQPELRVHVTMGDFDFT